MKIISITLDILLTSLILLMVILPVMANAQANFDLNNGQLGLGNQDLKTIINNIIQLLLSFLGIFSVLIILYGGFLWMTSMGDDAKAARARKTIVSGIIGIIIIISAYSIASFVINNIQNAVTG